MKDKVSGKNEIPKETTRLNRVLSVTPPLVPLSTLTIHLKVIK